MFRTGEKPFQPAVYSSVVPLQWDLAYLSTDSETGKDYLRWMNLAMAFANENRWHMMRVVIGIVKRLAEKYAGITELECSKPISCHHNYAAYEEHYGKKVWIHRKGNPESFLSCSHGAGRIMSRHAAKAQFSVDRTINDLKSRGVFLGKQKKLDVSEETRFAYKEIEFVIANELDLIEPVKRLKTMAVVKG